MAWRFPTRVAVVLQQLRAPLGRDTATVFGADVAEPGTTNGGDTYGKRDGGGGNRAARGRDGARPTSGDGDRGQGIGTGQATGTAETPAATPTTQTPYFKGVPDLRREDFRPGATIYYANQWGPFTADTAVAPLPGVNYYMQPGDGDDPALRIQETPTVMNGWEYWLDRDSGRVGRRAISGNVSSSAVAGQQADSRPEAERREYLRYGHQATILRVDGDRIITFEAGYGRHGAGVQLRAGDMQRADGSVTAHANRRGVYVAWAPERPR